ncbi:MAG TPA: BON domain-containing protein [Terriglobales bacterium]|nr:BON domain-containing protein [Terriglobales bacterium]
MERKWTGAAVLAVVVLALAGLSVAQTATHAGARYDGQIQQDVNQKLQQKDKLRGVSATSEDGIVTLTGTVEVYQDKVNAEKTARKVDHVAGVRNLVEVGPQVSDAQLQEEISRKLRYDRVGHAPVFDSLTLAVQQGVVTVGGTVRDYPARDVALADVRSTAGVKDVVDEIKVAPLSPNDDRIRLAVARAVYGAGPLNRYAMDPAAPIRIVVVNGHVELDGQVNTELEKTVAGIQANSVPGVFSVKNNLMVAGSSEGD